MEEKCFGPGVGGATVAHVFESEGEIRGAAVECGKYLRLIAVDRDFRRRGIGSALLRACAAVTVAGAEPGNYFTPGIVESDAGTMSFLTAHAFAEGHETWTLHVETPGRETPHNPVKTGVTEALIEFVRREFGEVWGFEVARAQSAVWIDGVGFAAVEANNRGLGTFGPSGVAKGHRRMGHGRTLLLAALGELARLGYRQAVIPWTDALDFYRRSCGAEPAHRFVTLARR